MTNEEKKELFDAWKGGDKTAYNKLYKDMYATVFDAVKANLEKGKQDSADSIAQDVMVKVFKSVDTLEDTSNSDEWLKNIVADYLGDKKEIPDEVIADAVTPEKVENAEAESEKTDEEHAKEENKTEDAKAEPIVNESNEEKKEEESAPKAEPVVNTSENTSVKKLSTPKNKKTVFGVIAAVVVVVIIAIFAVLNSTPTIDMNKYATVTFEGYDGYGSASVDVDWDKISKDYKGKIKFSKEGKANAQEFLGGDIGDSSAIDLLKICIDESVDTNDKDGELKNNDKVTVEWEINSLYENYLKVKIKADDKGFTVKNLETAKAIDIFKELEVTYEGADGQGVASVSSSNKEYNMISDNDFDKNSELSNGDKIKLTLNEEFINKISSEGIVPKEVSKEYVVEGLPKYADKIDDLSDETWEKIKAQAKDMLTEKFTIYDTWYTMENPEYIGNYVLCRKNITGIYDPKYYSNNYAGVIFKATAIGTDSRNTGLSETVYFNVYFDNITVDANGGTDADLVSNGSIDSEYHNSDVLIYPVDGYTSVEDAHSGIVDTMASEFTADWNVKE